MRYSLNGSKNLTDLLEKCSERKIQLQPEGSRLRFRAPKGALTSEIKIEIAGHRAELIEHLRRQGSEAKGSFPLSYGQKALWFIQKSTPETSAFNVAVAARITSRVNVTALRNALQALVDRHGSLRTVYRIVNEQPLQMVQAFSEVYFEEVDSSKWSEHDLRNQVARAYHTSFDLEKGPLLRVHFFTSTTTEHVLLMTMHHIACDGWSGWILLDELRDLYRIEADGLQSTLPLPQKQYSEFVEWEAENLAGQRGRELHAFWQEYLSGDLPVLNLPTDRPRPKTFGYHGGTRPIFLNSEITRELKELARSHGTTLFVTLLAGYFIMLYRYSGQEDLIVGTPTFGRGQAEYDKTVGCFVNQVPIRTRLSGNPRFSEFLECVRNTALGALSNQEYPFHLMAENFWRHRDRSIPPLCQAEFIFQKPQKSSDLLALVSPSRSAERINFGGLTLKYFQLPQQEGQLDLTLEMIESGGCLHGNLKFNSDLFDDSSVERMAESFQHLMKGVANEPDPEVMFIPLMTENEHHRIVVDWNRTAVDFSIVDCIHQKFEAQAESTPDKFAVEQNGNKLTYRQLNKKANQLAGILRSHGVRREVIVGLAMERTPEMIVGMIAILKAGGAYLPLDPSYPEAHLHYLVNDSGAPLVLTQTRFVERFEKICPRLLCIDSALEAISGTTEDGNAGGAAQTDPAYIIYTSGSTGRPKGVTVSHESLCNFVESSVRDLRLTATDRVLQFASISFDASIEEIFPCLTIGATLVLRTDTMMESISAFLQKCRDWRISILDLPTAFWHELVMGIENESLSFPEQVRLVIIGGERAKFGHLKTWMKEIGNSVRLINTYGPTETTVVATSCDLSRYAETALQMKDVPIGKPIANVQAYVIDKFLQPVPVGVPGELCIGGKGVSMGYMNLPESTCDKFIPHPIPGHAGKLVYRTGDLVRFLEDGNLQFLGRIDSQVKIRGYRIELGEIETELKRHGAVKDLHVSTVEDSGGQKRLVAYVVADNRAEISPSDLRQYLRQRLPDHMVPSHFVWLDRLPTTPAGKIDIGALPPPGGAESAGDRQTSAPRNEVEAALVRIWMNTLEVNTVGINDNFFDLGGQSLLLLRLLGRIKHEFRVDVSFQQFFETPTIAQISKVIEAMTYLNDSLGGANHSSFENLDEVQI